MLQLKTIDLHEYYGHDKGAERAGILTCIFHNTPKEISPDRRRPGVLILPGGGYYKTSAREAEPIALRFAAAGYSAFVLRYSVAPNIFPIALREAAMAMRYIRENCTEFEVDPHMIAAIGFSAGGHLCGTLGTMYDAQEVADIGPSETVRPDALGLCYPVVVSWGNTHYDSFRNLTGGDRELAERLSLEKLIRTDMPPVFLWHTRDDATVPSRNSLICAQALDDAGVDYSLRIYRSGRHGLSTADSNTYPVDQVPNTSKDILGWESRMIAFFEECGLKMWDAEGEA